MPIHVLNMAVICIQKQDYTMADIYLNAIKAEDFEQRAYLFYATKSDYYSKINQLEKALKYIDLALKKVTNTLEKDYLEKKKSKLILNKKN
jgi:RNA polymerase sigma-70 factor (ECF subfamily)